MLSTSSFRNKEKNFKIRRIPSIKKGNWVGISGDTGEGFSVKTRVHVAPLISIRHLVSGAPLFQIRRLVSW